MTPSAQQKQLLQDNLKEILTYRETYEEVYDHILSALANEPDDITIGDAINKIMRNDFGGYKKLQQLEKTIKKALVKDTLQQYCKLLGTYFQVPALFYTIIFIGTIWYFISMMNLSILGWAILLLVPMLTPHIIINIRDFRKGYMLGDTKKSARDRIFRNISRVPLSVFAIIYFTAKDFGTSYNREYITVGFLMLNMHALTIVRLYNYEFNKLIIKT
jgi:hypothetical protein